MAKQIYTAFCKNEDGEMIQISGEYECRYELWKEIENGFPHLRLIAIVSEEDVELIKDTLK